MHDNVKDAHWRVLPQVRVSGDFRRRLDQHGPRLRQLLAQIYGSRSDFDAWFEKLIAAAAAAYGERPEWLRALDAEREKTPDWFCGNDMLGGVCYVDLYAGNLAGIRKQLPYFKKLGLTYLHLMPLFKAPEHESDGGYAVSSYRDVNPALGSMRQFSALMKTMHAQGIATCVDFIFNHTSDEHDWAMRAKAGDPHYRDFYFLVDRATADQYETHLREIFPDEHAGAFSPLPGGEWVWTTFHKYQWDLNYANPNVFGAMAGEMLFLANQGVQVLRMDAVAFIWKRLGTSCENLPEAHTLIQAFNALCRIAAPALLFKSEAIVHPDDVAKYISPAECQISYNPLLMALLWNSLATRKVRLLRKALAERHHLPPGAAWVNYVRVHDDIGWTFSDEDAAQLGVNGFDHRRFLNQFFTNRFNGSFARGLPFQENEKTGDCRISGTCASLAGLEQALASNDPAGTELSLRRIALIHGIALAAGGIPLIYLGDELAQLNDYAYAGDPAKAGDSRWVHRPINPAARARSNAEIDAGNTLQQRLVHLIALRRQLPAFAVGELRVVATGSDHVLGFIRQSGNHAVLVLANFSEHARVAQSEQLSTICQGATMRNAIDGSLHLAAHGVALGPYQMVWLISV